MSQPLKVGILLGATDIKGLLKTIDARVGQLEAEQRATGRQSHAGELVWLKAMRQRIMATVGAGRRTPARGKESAEEAEFSTAEAKSAVNDEGNCSE